MDEGRITKGSSGKSKGKKGLVVIALVAIVVLVVSMAILSGSINTVGSKNDDKLITKANEDLVINLSDLPAGWKTDISYRLDPDRAGPNITEVGVVRYNHTLSMTPSMVEFVTVIIHRINSTDSAKAMFNELKSYSEDGVLNYQGVDIFFVGNESIGDEAFLFSGNWTGSHAAIKFITFRENNVIVILVYEATEKMNLTNAAAIDLAIKQDAKLLS
jgi:hypothetical protein